MDCKRYSDELVKAGKWFAKPRAFLQIMDSLQSDVLCYVLSICYFKADSQGWILCTEKFLRNGLYLTLEEERSAVAHLLSIGILEVQKRPSQDTRHLRVNCEKLDAVLAEASARVCVTR